MNDIEWGYNPEITYFPSDTARGNTKFVLISKHSILIMHVHTAFYMQVFQMSRHLMTMVVVSFTV